MHGRKFAVTTRDGRAMTAELFAAPGSYGPGLVMVPAIFGLHDPERAIAWSYAELGFPVHEAQDGDRLTAGAAWLAPGDFHMEVQRDGTRVVARLHQGPAVNSCRPSVDVLFRSVAAVYGGGALAVVLTGMGDDGRRGCEWLKREGASVIAQDEASSVVWGMPGSVVKAGLADDILPLAEVAAAIRRRVAARRVSP